jgi:hypothetical protein
MLLPNFSLNPILIRVNPLNRLDFISLTKESGGGGVIWEEEREEASF